MANDLNQCTFIGRLGRDPEVRTMPSGDQIVNFSIAVGETWKDRNSGEKKERTEWINIVVGGGLAGVASEYLHKGAQVAIVGKLRTRKWTDQATGQERYATEIRADSMQMLGGREGGQQQSGYGDSDHQPQRRAPAPRSAQPPAAPPRAPAPPKASGFDDMDDDIPF